jgi:hypothetical protein
VAKKISDDEWKMLELTIGGQTFAAIVADFEPGNPGVGEDAWVANASMRSRKAASVYIADCKANEK